MLLLLLLLVSYSPQGSSAGRVGCSGLIDFRTDADDGDDDGEVDIVG